MRRLAFVGALCLLWFATFAALKSRLPTPSANVDFPAQITESKRPHGAGAAVFLRVSAFTAGTVTMYISDPARSRRPRRVGDGYASDGSAKMKRAAWSRDGSVVAVFAALGEPRGHGFGKFWVAAYDFRTHAVVGPGLSRDRRSQVIERLLKARGGEGKPALKLPYAEGKDITRRQAEEFKP